MICIECCNSNINSLYSEFKNNYIILTRCNQCNKIADKYIEYDNVVLFVDVLLLKKQAYRHVVYNITEMELYKIQNMFLQKMKYCEKNNVSFLIKFFHKTSMFFLCYRLLIQFVMINVFFEVYLVWANEDKKKVHSILLSFVLDQCLFFQYIFFFMYLITKQLVLNVLILTFFYGFSEREIAKMSRLELHFNKAYRNLVLLKTISISCFFKLLSILMLTWPYLLSDVSSIMIKITGFLTFIESLKIITNERYVYVTIYLLCSYSVLYIVSKIFVWALVQYNSDISLLTIVLDEYNFLLKKFFFLLEFFKGFPDFFKSK